MLLSRATRGLLGSGLALVVVLLGLAATAAAYANPGSCSGYCWAHDPSVVKRADGTYFRFSTGGGIEIATASSLSGSWTYKGVALPGGSSISASGNSGPDCWAPMVLLVDTTYHLYYAVSSFGSKVSAIGYATSTTMEVGSWTDHGATGVSSGASTNYNAIDPSVFKDASGAYHMTFGSFWTGIQIVPMASPPKSASGTPALIAYQPATDHAEEGSFVHYRGGYYYLFYSAGHCCGYDKGKPVAGLEYSIRVCRSKSPTGGYVDQAGTACTAGGGTVVLASHDKVYGPGGQGILSDGGDVLYYHYADTSVGLADADYKFGYNTISWSSSDWPTV